MPLSFSFFSQKRAASSEITGGIAVAGTETDQLAAAPQPKPESTPFKDSLLNAYAESGAAVMPKRIPTASMGAPMPTAAAPATTGTLMMQAGKMSPTGYPLAAFAGMSTATPPKLPTAPHVNASFPLPGPAISANLAQAAHEDEMNWQAEVKPVEAQKKEEQGHAEWHGHQTSRDLMLAELKEKISADVAEVKNDIFGAVMGVSALKDRLDGVEGDVAAMAKKSVAIPSQEALQAWMQGWIESNLSRIIEEAVSKALETAVPPETQPHWSSRLSGWSASVPLPDAGTLFCQPPVILSSSRS